MLDNVFIVPLFVLLWIMLFVFLVNGLDLTHV